MYTLLNNSRTMPIDTVVDFLYWFKLMFLRLRFIFHNFPIIFSPILDKTLEPEQFLRKIN